MTLSIDCAGARILNLEQCGIEARVTDAVPPDVQWRSLIVTRHIYDHRLVDGSDGGVRPRAGAGTRPNCETCLAAQADAVDVINARRAIISVGSGRDKGHDIGTVS